MKKVAVTDKAMNAIKNGNPLISSEDVLGEIDGEVGLVTFVNKADEFVASGYIGRQNKGIGWVLSVNCDDTIDMVFVEKKLQDAHQKRHHFFRNLETTSCFRWFNGEGDGIGGMTVDYYNDNIVVSWYNSTIYKFSDAIITEIKKLMPTLRGVFEKIRFKDEKLPESRCVYSYDESYSLVTKENSIQYAIYLDEGLMTGIFLDQRNVRKKLASGLVKNKTVLNTFSYTGAFSIAAKVGGAKETTSVDLAKRSREKTEEQFEINGLDPSNEKIYVMDIFDFFSYAQRKSLKYDCVVLDPPSFARNKKKFFSVEKNYGTLIEQAIKVLTKDGLLIASTNSANMSYKKFKLMVEKSLTTANKKFEMIASERLPDDFTTLSKFPESNYLKVLIYQLR